MFFRKTPVKSLVDYFQNQKIDNENAININTNVNINTDTHKKMEILNVYTDGSCINNGKPNA